MSIVEQVQRNLFESGLEKLLWVESSFQIQIHFVNDNLDHKE